MLRYRIRTLLILIVLSAVILGLHRQYISPFRNQAKACTQIVASAQIVTAKAEQNWVLQIILGDEYVKVVEARFHHDANPQCFQYIRNLPFLERLYLEHTEIEDSDLRVVETCKQLKRLSLRRTRVSDAGLRYLSSLPNLEVLSIRNTAATSQALNFLPRCLRQLDAGPKVFCLDNLSQLEEFPKLKIPSHLRHWGDPPFETDLTDDQKHAKACHWALGNVHVKTEHQDDLPAIRYPASRVSGVWFLPHIKSLSAIEITGVDYIKREHLEVLSQCQQLKSFKFYDINRYRTLEVDDWWVVDIATFPCLEELVLSHWEIDGWSLKYLESIPTLRRLDVSNNLITSKQLAGIQHLKSLRWLNLSGNPIDDSAIKTLGELTGLEDLKLNETKISQAGLRRLRRMLPETKIEDFKM